MKNKKILLGVCGSISAYKAVFLTRLLVKNGAEVKVILTPSATDFIQPLTFSTLSKNECLVSYTRSDGQWNNHVDLALWADLMLIAPATVSTISKMANAHCDNLLIGTYLSARCPVFIAPAMDEDMYHHPANQQNIKKLLELGHQIIPVDEGELASGLFGKGRLAEPEMIVDFLEHFFTPHNSVLINKKVVITAGPTYEHIDPVRFIGNHSSGKMGIALAIALADKGADVKLILGPSSIQVQHSKIQVIPVVSANEMYEEAQKYFDNLDIIVFAAAVADYRPISSVDHKIKKQDDHLTIQLKKNVDIAASFGSFKKDRQISVGFALETRNEEEYAKEKLKKKNFDIVILNSLAEEGAGFKYDTNKIKIIDKNFQIASFEMKSKTEVANDIVHAIENLL
ncbi:MAG: bifunctional phosphopantothenoylcysteine decarboxylase/phosphopantothenate--cysteine ligase CoaBC [Chitinophagales bacterium]|nr:bifunctional phosphopantothenoylcysteine decarboxylase/phosphopantothenate--cysteine ligase CoaBC [Chitinophagales bacterium]MCZ2393735.1 bifunctional phosphopantothenoylcysteine decarboxylase/phosphopantothenate--cysteine ligase CoaBC [Chitinophagales bacterium]